MATRGPRVSGYCGRKLAAPVGELSAFENAAAAVARAAAVADGALAGVIAFGSWARSELHDASDIDLLVVVDRTPELSRSLHRRWDEDPVIWEGRRVEPHFVTLLESSAPVVGLWAEAAVDGIVLFARDLELAFYGAEDLTPSGFYTREDADRARSGARRVVTAVRPHVPS